MRIERERIPVLDIASEFLQRFSMDPLGTLASGSLVVCCRGEGAQAILDAWAKSGIEGAVIGEVTEGTGVILVENGVEGLLPEFPTDEITKMFPG
jgi:hydrogenase expression/formation protein HypE